MTEISPVDRELGANRCARAKPDAPNYESARSRSRFSSRPGWRSRRPRSRCCRSGWCGSASLCSWSARRVHDDDRVDGFARPSLTNWTSIPVIVVIAGYANDYAGYVTTHEEYESQQYEGGHTLFGPWTEAGYRQEFVRLAHALKTGKPIESSAMPEDMRTRKIARTILDGPDETAAAEGQVRRRGRRRERAVRSRRSRDGEFLDRQPGERIPAKRSLYGRRAAHSRTQPMGSRCERISIGIRRAAGNRSSAGRSRASRRASRGCRGCASLRPLTSHGPSRFRSRSPGRPTRKRRRARIAWCISADSRMMARSCGSSPRRGRLRSVLDRFCDCDAYSISSDGRSLANSDLGSTSARSLQFICRTGVVSLRNPADRNRSSVVLLPFR